MKRHIRNRIVLAVILCCLVGLLFTGLFWMVLVFFLLVIISMMAFHISNLNKKVKDAAELDLELESLSDGVQAVKKRNKSLLNKLKQMEANMVLVRRAHSREIERIAKHEQQMSANFEEHVKWLNKRVENEAMLMLHTVRVNPNEEIQTQAWNIFLHNVNCSFSQPPKKPTTQTPPKK